jgi:hypothetical protein
LTLFAAYLAHYAGDSSVATDLHPKRVRVNEHALLHLERRNEMLGLGLLGTIIVVVVIVWLIRRV